MKTTNTMYIVAFHDPLSGAMWLQVEMLKGDLPLPIKDMVLILKTRKPHDWDKIASAYPDFDAAADRAVKAGYAWKAIALAPGEN